MLKYLHLKINGHSLELRVYAEDPQNDFLPSIGKLERYDIPKAEGIRVDDGFTEGMEIPIYYDPMIAKLVVHAEDRKQAIQLMKEAITNYNIEGIKTTLPFGQFVMNEPHFISGDIDTHYVGKHFDKSYLINEKHQLAAALVAKHLFEKEQDKLRLPYR